MCEVCVQRCACRIRRVDVARRRFAHDIQKGLARIVERRRNRSRAQREERACGSQVGPPRQKVVRSHRLRVTLIQIEPVQSLARLQQVHDGALFASCQRRKVWRQMQHLGALQHLRELRIAPRDREVLGRRRRRSGAGGKGEGGGDRCEAHA